MDRTINNRYELLEIIGEGGMNTVYKAEDKETGNLVAIKILKSEFNDDEDVIKRFHMESEAIQNLDHENVVKVLDVGVDGDDHFLVMELLKLQTLKDVITENTVYFNNEDIINMSLQILSGIKIAHEKNIVHRDIKPQNILIDDDGNLKVSDFGIARVASSNTMKNTKDAIGSVHYASPEQARGSVVDKRSDIYSFGILLYELATGRLPFEGDTVVSIALKHTRGDVVDPCYLNLNLNPSIEAIIKRCIQKEPSQRFQTVDEIIDLFKILEENPNEELGPEHKELLIVPLDTINMSSVSPFLDGEKETKNNVEVTEVKQKLNILPMVITVVSAVAIAAMILFLTFWKPFRDTESAKPFELPNVVGQNFTEASELLVNKKLNVEKTDAVNDDKIPKNAIISQIPAAGAKVKAGQTVKVVVSLGKFEILAPKLIGETLERARVAAHNEGLEIKVEKEFSKKPQGIVIKQEPKDGEPVKDGLVVVTISLGEESGTQIMPNLYEKSRDHAVNTLSELKLIVGVIEPEYHETIGEGFITWQSVASGAEVSEGTMINMKISLGPDPEKNKEDDGMATVDENPEAENNSGENEGENEGEGSGNNEGENEGEGSGDNQGENEGEGSGENEGEENTNTTSYYIPLKQEKEEYAVKVIKEVDGVQEVLYNQVHDSSEGVVKIDVVGSGSMRLMFYIDDELFDIKDVNL